MKPLVLPMICTLLAGALIASASPLAVRQGIASQRAGTRLVDVAYDLSGGVPPYTVSLQGSLDGGVTWTLPVTTVSGNVGTNVTAGLGRKITWDAGTDWSGQVSTQVRFRITASDSASVDTPDGFSAIPAGSYQMGHYLQAQPVHTVQVSAFQMAKYEVTKELWDFVRAWGLGNGYSDLAAGNGSALSKGMNHPVHSITWYDAVKWCNARSEKEGLIPCYYTNAGQTLVYRAGTVGIDNTMVKWSANGYRLPTEAEWEKAARGGLSNMNYPWGDWITHSNANYYSSSLDPYDVSPTRGYHPTHKIGSVPYSATVGSFPKTGLDLYDMVGNMGEWCWDRYGGYSSAAQTDPKGPLTGSNRVARGGSWGNFSLYMNCFSRDTYYAPGQQSNLVGFRLARNAAP